VSTLVHLPIRPSAWTPLSPCEPATCVPERVVATAGPVRRAARLLGALTVILTGLPLALASRWARQSQRTRMTAMWSRLLLRALGIRVETRRAFAFVGGSVDVRSSPEEDGPELLVCNHVSWLDPLIVAATTPCRLLAKSEIARWPVIRTLAAGGGALFIERDRLSALPQMVGDMADALRAGDTVAAFPEGTTWCGREMGQFRPAVFQAAIDAAVPVRPLALRFAQDGVLSTVPSYVGDDTLLASIRRVVAVKGLVAEVTRFPRVRLTHPGGRCEGRKTLARITEAYVRTALTGSERELVAA
jgi:1-acyl-sn-glycerol-3-phosphate acyltransferase